MLDVTCDKPLSWYWQILIAVMLSMALGSIFFCVWRQALPWWFGLLIGLILIFYTFQQAMLLCWHKRPRSVIALRFSADNELIIHCQNGQRYNAQLEASSVVFAPITMLSIKARTFKTRVLIEACHVPSTDYHALARKVREIQNVQV